MFTAANNGVMTITRGDDASISLRLNVGTQSEPIAYDLGADDLVLFGVCEYDAPFEDAFIEKTLTSADFDYEEHSVKFKIDSDDTKPIQPGVYYYAVKLIKAEEGESAEYATDTLIGRTKFIIIE